MILNAGTNKIVLSLPRKTAIQTQMDEDSIIAITMATTLLGGTLLCYSSYMCYSVWFRRGAYDEDTSSDTEELYSDFKVLILPDSESEPTTP